MGMLELLQPLFCGLVCFLQLAALTMARLAPFVLLFFVLWAVVTALAATPIGASSGYLVVARSVCKNE